MRKFCFAAFAAVLIGTTACTPKAPEQFTGKIVDGTMNTVTVESPADGRRVTFTTEDADMQEAYGLLLGNTATVTYRGKLGETTPALKVVTDPAYVTAIGRWVEPNPIDPEQEQGIEIRVNGVAASINMLTLRYEAWELAPEGDRIILSGVSALKVVTDPAYVTAIGRWVEPNPIDPEQEQGIEIRVNGVAASINMLTLRYEAWELAPEGDRIILSGVSEGSGGPYPFEQTAEIIEMDGKPALKIDAVVLTKKDLI